MSDSKLPGSIDARDWAKEWLETIAKRPGIPTDEATMISWFANAIMAGYDTALARRDRWRPFPEELPEHGQDVIVLSTYVNGGRWWHAAFVAANVQAKENAKYDCKLSTPLPRDYFLCSDAVARGEESITHWWPFELPHSPTIYEVT